MKKEVLVKKRKRARELKKKVGVTGQYPGI